MSLFNWLTSYMQLLFEMFSELDIHKINQILEDTLNSECYLFDGMRNNYIKEQQKSGEKSNATSYL